MKAASPQSPYQVLGVAPSATPDEIRRSYRRLAKQHHPDANPGKPAAADRFAAIASAYALLSDPDRRARFDRGEIDAAGNDIPRHPHMRDATHGFPDDIEELLRHAMGGRPGRGSASLKGEDARYTLTVSFVDAALGARRRITLPDGTTLDVTIPPGHRDGEVLRLRQRGHPGLGGGPPGDALIEVSVAPHAFFRREGDDILLDLPVTLQEAVLGARIEVPTLTGTVTLTIPPRSGQGTRLRLRNRGINGGHQVVTLSLALPTQPEPALEEFLRSWNPDHPQSPRGDLKP